MTTRIYLDTSAAAKLFIAERETPDLQQWLAHQPEFALVSSALLNVELIRLLNFVSPNTVKAAEAFLANEVDIVEITPPVLGEAAQVSPTRLRTLNAIHLATALDLGENLTTLLTYDKLLIEAARASGLATACPGVTV